ncbi:MAG TPA: transcriptional regulator [Candidatus Saccharimonas sp.]|jgi:predicted transcriptional regulator|nr:transcriptional regulator [Candidatus Saccharimonas sp.]
MIDALFGSKTRVKLLHLFLNNPGKAFYVREITRLIDEQINSVRRELANMLEVGIITSDSADNKLYYEINQRYQYYLPFRAIFADQGIVSKPLPDDEKTVVSWHRSLKSLPGVRVAVIAGVLLKSSASQVDLLLVGSPVDKKVNALVEMIEHAEGREISYAVLSYDEFYYRLSVRDRFITAILTNRYQVMVDTDNILKD